MGPKWEYESEFYYEGDIPPFVQAESYEQALQLCQSMSDEAIDKQRDAMIGWYIARLKYTQRRLNWEIFHMNHTFTEWNKMEEKESDPVYEAVLQYRNMMEASFQSVDKCGAGVRRKKKQRKEGGEGGEGGGKNSTVDNDDDDQATIYDKESHELEHNNKEYASLMD